MLHHIFMLKYKRCINPWGSVFSILSLLSGGGLGDRVFLYIDIPNKSLLVHGCILLCWLFCTLWMLHWQFAAVTWMYLLLQIYKMAHCYLAFNKSDSVSVHVTFSLPVSILSWIVFTYSNCYISMTSSVNDTWQQSIGYFYTFIYLFNDLCLAQININHFCAFFVLQLLGCLSDVIHPHILKIFTTEISTFYHQIHFIEWHIQSINDSFGLVRTDWNRSYSQIIVCKCICQ